MTNEMATILGIRVFHQKPVRFILSFIWLFVLNYQKIGVINYEASSRKLWVREDKHNQSGEFELREFLRENTEKV